MLALPRRVYRWKSKNLTLTFSGRNLQFMLCEGMNQPIMILYFKLLFFASFLFTSVHGSVLTQGCNWGDEDKQIKAAVSQAREVAIGSYDHVTPQGSLY